MPTAFGEMDIIDKILGGTAEDREKKRTSYLDEIARVAESDRAEKAPGGYEAGPNTTPEETVPDTPIAVPGFNSDGTPVGGTTTSSTTPKKVGAADADIVEDAIRPFDIKAIADKYGDPQGGGYVGPETGSVFTEKEISKKDSKGLIKRGFVENAEGKRVYIYAKEPEKEKEGGTADAASNPHEVAYNAIVKQVEKYHGITDLRKFNVVTETKNAMDKLKDDQWNWTFGANTRMEDLTPEQRKHWDGVMRELYTRTYNEIATKAQLARTDVEKFMGMYEKNRDKFATAKAGDTIYDKNTGKIVSQVADKEKRLPEGVAKDVEGGVASFFKPIAQQGAEGLEVKNEDVVNKLDANHQALYKELRRDAYEILRKNPKLSAFEAVDEAIKAKGWWAEADTDEAKTMKMWRTPQGAGRKVTPGTKLDKDTATSILKEAGGDKAKARQVARERGYTI
jgi:hypothetical protein